MCTTLERYSKIKLLGEGAFGKVYLVRCETSGELAVIKEIDIRRLSEVERKQVLKEAKIMEPLRHPNIIRFREVYKTKKGNLCIVMDYADGGDLMQRIKAAKGKYFSETQVLDWFTQLSLALKHCHDRKILHRDLKSQNVFLTSRNTIKLGDFGISRVMSSTLDKAKTIVGTPYYLSPEIIQNKSYGFESDIWSLGVILYELCSHKPPFNASSLSGLATRIVRGAYPQIPGPYSRELKILSAQMLCSEPLKRPSITKILRNPLIQSRIQAIMSQTIYKLVLTQSILKPTLSKNEYFIEKSDKPEEGVRRVLPTCFYKLSGNEKKVQGSPQGNPRKLLAPPSVFDKPKGIIPHVLEQIDKPENKILGIKNEIAKQQLSPQSIKKITETHSNKCNNDFGFGGKIIRIKDSKKLEELELMKARMRRKEVEQQELQRKKEDNKKETERRIRKREEARKKIIHDRENNHCQKDGVKEVPFEFITKSYSTEEKVGSLQVEIFQTNIETTAETKKCSSPASNQSIYCSPLDLSENPCSLQEIPSHLKTPKQNTIAHSDMIQSTNPFHPENTKPPLKKEIFEHSTAQPPGKVRMGTLKEEIMRMRREGEGGGKKTLENFSVEDVLFVKPLYNTEKIDEVSTSIMEKSKKSREEEKEILHIIDEMKNLLQVSPRETECKLEEISEEFEDREDLDDVVPPINPIEEEKLGKKMDISESKLPEQLSVLSTLEQDTNPKSLLINQEYEFHSQFENIEAIIYYLENTHGFETFKEIYEAIREIDENLREKEQGIEEYQKQLGSLVTGISVQSLFLFLVLRKMEKRAQF